MKLSHPYRLLSIVALVVLAITFFMGTAVETDINGRTEIWNPRSIGIGTTVVLFPGSVGYWVLRGREIHFGLTQVHLWTWLVGTAALLLHLMGLSGMTPPLMSSLDIQAGCVGLFGLGAVCYLINMAMQLLVSLLR